MSYTRVNWQDQPSTATPINAQNLNTMDSGIADLETSLNSSVSTINSTVTALSNRAKVEKIVEKYDNIPTNEQQVYDLISGKKFSDYDLILFHIKTYNNVYDTVVVPSTDFASMTSIGAAAVYISNSNANLSFAFARNSDTKLAVLKSQGPSYSGFRVFGIKL